jgi:exonuclease III
MQVNGTESPYKDPISGEAAGTRHDRKLQVHEFLAAECCALEAQGYSVILAGDMNVARARIDGHPNLRTFPVSIVKPLSRRGD